VITHDHADRDGGLGALLRRKIPVAALDLTVEKLERRQVAGVTTLFKASDSQLRAPRGFEPSILARATTPTTSSSRFPTATSSSAAAWSSRSRPLTLGSRATPIWRRGRIQSAGSRSGTR